MVRLLACVATAVADETVSSFDVISGIRALSAETYAAGVEVGHLARDMVHEAGPCHA